MEYTKLGNTNISRICLGCMTFGDSKGNPDSWLLNQEETNAMVKRALDLGINFFDTANMYNGGSSEIYLGNALKKYAKREDVVIATKVRFNEGGLSRNAILREVDMSLKKLQTTYIDLLIIHRWDYDTSIEETMETLNQVIEEGKVRYIGASAMYAYQFLKAQETARKHGWHTFVSMQNHYNLIYREEEREMVKLLLEEGVIMTPYSPLAGGRVARKWDAESNRSKNDQFAKRKYDFNRDLDYPIVLRVEELAKKYNISMAQISMAWLLSKQGVAAPIVGVTKIKHLEDAISSIDVKLTQEDIDYLEELYMAHNVVGALSTNELK